MASDKARIDWLDSSRFDSLSGHFCHWNMPDFHGPVGRTLRQAIDAAILAEKKSERLARRTARPKKAGGKR